MLATFGLERLETGLGDAEGRAEADLADLIEQVNATPTGSPERSGVELAFAPAPGSTFVDLDDEPRGTVRIRQCEAANPQFHAPRHANRV